MVLRDQDPRATVVDADTFVLITELEIRKAIRLQYYVSVLALQAGLEGAESAGSAPGLASQLARILSPQLRGTDLIGLTGSYPTLELLLVAAHLSNLPTIIQRITREVSRHALQIDDEPRVVNLSLGGACFPGSARDREDLMGQAVSLLTEACQDRSERYRYRLAPTRP